MPLPRVQGAQGCVMNRRHRKPPKPKRIDGALIVVAPGPHVVEQAARSIAEARAVSLARRDVERALRAAGLSKRQACVTVAGMAHDDLLAEAERVRAISDPVDATKRPWWQRMLGGKS